MKDSEDKLDAYIRLES